MTVGYKYFGGQAMQVNEYDVVLLKDGREAIVIEKFDDTHFMIDAAQTADEWGIIDITMDEIDRVMYKPSN